MSQLTASNFFDHAPTLNPARVELPELGDSAFVYVMAHTADQRDQIESEWLPRREKKELVGWRAFMAARVVCDENNNPLFAPAQYDETAAKFANYPATVCDRIVTVYNKLNGVSEEDQRELEKNSQSATSYAGNGELH